MVDKAENPAELSTKQLDQTVDWMNREHHLALIKYKNLFKWLLAMVVTLGGPIVAGTLWAKSQATSAAERILNPSAVAKFHEDAAAVDALRSALERELKAIREGDISVRSLRVLGTDGEPRLVLEAYEQERHLSGETFEAGRVRVLMDQGKVLAEMDADNGGGVLRIFSVMNQRDPMKWHAYVHAEQGTGHAESRNEP